MPGEALRRMILLLLIVIAGFALVAAGVGFAGRMAS
jgi:hypothetical protein